MPVLFLVGSGYSPSAHVGELDKVITLRVGKLYARDSITQLAPEVRAKRVFQLSVATAIDLHTCSSEGTSIMAQHLLHEVPIERICLGAKIGAIDPSFRDNNRAHAEPKGHDRLEKRVPDSITCLAELELRLDPQLLSRGTDHCACTFRCGEIAEPDHGNYEMRS